MTADTDSANRGRSLRDDLLDDLRQGGSRPTTPVTPPAEPRFSSAPPSQQTPTVELKITPRSWSPVVWTPRPTGGGFTLSVGPVRLSLALANS
jgi:hypothetical protein